MDEKLIPGPVKGYKMVDENLCCRGVQFVVGEIVRHEGPLEMCRSGFHFCVHPSGVWAYYNKGRLFELEAYDVLDTPYEPGADLKKVCRGIRLVREIKVDGDGNTGNGNTGHRNTGNGNTGDGNTGNGNTGYGNTGDGNTCDRSSGHFNTHTPKLIIFDKPTSLEPDANLVFALSVALMSSEPFDPLPFLSLPNATARKIKKLHRLHIQRRQEQEV